MQYLHKSKKKSKFTLYLTISVFAFIVLLRYFAPTFMGNIVFFFATPFMRGSADVGSASVGVTGVFTSKESLQSENELLKDQLAQLQVVSDRDKLLVQENTDLKELLGRHSSNASVLATVITKPPLSLYDTIIVDVGADQKVAVGDKVIALGFVPIGTVYAVYAHTSLVRLFSSSGEQISVSIGKNIQTTAQAQGGGNFVIKLPKGTAIKEGDPISAPGIEADVFGKVDSIETNDNEPFLYVRFSLPINMAELHFVQIDRANSI